jgi:hypothetical protein
MPGGHALKATDARQKARSRPAGRVRSVDRRRGLHGNRRERAVGVDESSQATASPAASLPRRCNGAVVGRLLCTAGDLNTGLDRSACGFGQHVKRASCLGRQ